MTKHARNHADDLRGATSLAMEAIQGVTELIEAMHVTIASGPAILGQPFAGPVRAATRPVYAMIQGVMQLVGGGIDLALAQLVPVFGASSPGVEREAILAALNGVLGDSLLARDNPLAIEMRLRHGGQPLELTREALHRALPHATRKAVVLVHGLCMNDLQWTRRGHDHGSALARDLGYTPVHVHYNSGLHISTNGHQLAALLDQLVAAWPVALDELVLVGHSMGGLVARSACHAGDVAGHAWRPQLRALICLGSPHHGAPLERGGAWVDLILGLSHYSAPLARLGKIRSAGITDLRFGDVLDEHWRGFDRFAHREDRRLPCPLPAGVQCYAIAATRGSEADDLQASDGLVPVASALGLHATSELTVAFPDEHRWIALETDHIGLLGAASVHEQLRSWLSSR
jgi:pimeloyl-ACP methyl ester carboxylesterase